MKGTRLEDKAPNDPAMSAKPGPMAMPKRRVGPAPNAAGAGVAAAGGDGAAQLPTRKPAGRARARRRHLGLMLSFLLIVALPVAAAGVYLFAIADDQYATRVGFSVRKEETSTAIEILGGITQLAGTGSNDTDILFEYIQSANMVRAVNGKVDLVAAYSRDNDPFFALGEDTRIEALTDYWNTMVDVYFDRSSGLIEIRVRAFTPEEALAIAEAIRSESTRTINALSETAREDATRYAREELDKAIERLKVARSAITAFRTKNQIVDPEADIQGRMGLLNTLQAELADALIELDLLRQNSRADDPRIVQGERRVDVIRNRIRAERARFSEDSESSQEQEAYSQIVSQYEALAVDRKFAEEAYVAALAGFDGATAAAQRQSLYLATFVEPELAETAEYPRRWVILLTLLGALLTGWIILAMIYYSLRDRR